MPSIQRNIPYYLQVANALRSELQSGKYPELSEFPDEMTLAKRFGVSKEVVRQSRRILCGEHLIRTVKGRGTYVLPLERQEYKVVQLNLFHSTIHTMRILQAIQRVTMKENYLLSAHATDLFSIDMERHALEKAMASQCKVIVTCPSFGLEDQDNSETYRRIQQQGIPLILFDRFLEGFPADQIYFDNERTGYEMIRDIAGECDARHLFVLADDSYRVSALRHRGLMRGLREFFPQLSKNNILINSAIDVIYKTAFPPDMVIAHLKSHHIVPEILVGNGTVLFALYNELRKRKLHRHIRKIVSVQDLTFSDEEFNALNIGYYRDFNELGQEVAKTLKHRLLYGNKLPYITKGLPFKKLTWQQATQQDFSNFIQDSLFQSIN